VRGIPRKHTARSFDPGPLSAQISTPNASQGVCSLCRKAFFYLELNLVSVIWNSARYSPLGAASEPICTLVARVAGGRVLCRSVAIVTLFVERSELGNASLRNMEGHTDVEPEVLASIPRHWQTYKLTLYFNLFISAFTHIKWLPHIQVNESHEIYGTIWKKKTPWSESASKLYRPSDQTIPTERPPLVSEVIANFCG
jgi:hypothetical protein